MRIKAFIIAVRIGKAFAVLFTVPNLAFARSQADSAAHGTVAASIAVLKRTFKERPAA